MSTANVGFGQALSDRPEIIRRAAAVRARHFAAKRDPPPRRPLSLAAAAKRDYFRAWRRIVAG